MTDHDFEEWDQLVEERDALLATVNEMREALRNCTCAPAATLYPPEPPQLCPDCECCTRYECDHVDCRGKGCPCTEDK